jgi:hypothetical protein
LFRTKVFKITRWELKAAEKVYDLAGQALVKIPKQYSSLIFEKAKSADLREYYIPPFLLELQLTQRRCHSVMSGWLIKS